MDRSLSCSARIRIWRVCHWKEVILVCAVGLISAAIVTVLVLWHFFPIPLTK